VPPAAPATAAVPARRRILDTARRLFAAEGIQAAGVDRIVAEAQVVKATFYRHFPAKDDLVCAYLAELSERQLAALRRLPADAELPHALVEIVGGPPYRGSPFINAAAEYADPDHPVRRLIGRHRRAFRELLVPCPRCPPAQTRAPSPDCTWSCATVWWRVPTSTRAPIASKAPSTLPTVRTVASPRPCRSGAAGV